MGKIVSGAALCESFYRRCVRPVFDRYCQNVPHSAALLDYGSEVLGFDDEMSRDHHWGPRVLLFLRDNDYGRFAESLRTRLSTELPRQIDGYPIGFSAPDSDGVQHPEDAGDGPVNHRVEIHTVAGFAGEYLGLNLSRCIDPADWLSSSEQRLRTVVEGPVYHDEVGLSALRDRLRYYPRDVWLYQMAGVWTRIGEDEHLMGRAGMVGDELGSAVIGARLVRDIMRLCFMMEQRYVPYPKWFGTAFSQLKCAGDLQGQLEAVVHARSWQEREDALVRAYEVIAERHNGLGLTEPVQPEVVDFHGRPFRVIALRGHAQALLREIRDPAVKKLAERPVIGGLDLFSENTSLTENLIWKPSIRRLYEA